MATILVEVLGSAKQFKAEMAAVKAETAETSGALSKLGKAAIVAGAAVAGGVAFGIFKSVEAAEAMQVQTVRMNAAFAASGVSSKAFAGRIEEAEASARNLGFTNESVRGSLGSLVIATHNGSKAIKDLSVAQDIARFKHISLESATKVLTMAMSGSQRATKQLGIDVPKVTSHYDAMRKTMGPTIDAHEKLALAQAKVQDKLATANLVIGTVTEKLKGQAKAYSETAAGSMAAFHAQIDNLLEQIGVKLLPTLTKVTAWLVKELPVAVAFVQGVIARLSAIFEQHRAQIQAVFDFIRNTVIPLAMEAWPKYVNLIKTELAIAVTIVQAAISAISTAIDFVRDTVIPAAMAAWAQYGPTIKKTFDDVVTIIRGAVTAISTVITTLVTFIHSNWATIWAVIGPIVKMEFEVARTAVVTSVKVITDIIHAFAALLKGDWGGAWGALKEAVSTALGGVASITGSTLRGLANTAKGLADAIGKAIAAGIKTAATHLVGLAGDLTGKIYSALVQVTSWAAGAAESIGREIIKGVVIGVATAPYELGKAIAGKVGGAIKWAADNTGSTTAEASAKWLGVPLARGVIEGWIAGTATLPTTLTQGMQNAITAARTVIQGAQAAFQSDWSQIASDADTALSGIQGAVQTKAGKKLSGLQSAHDAQGRQNTLTDTRNALAVATAGGDPATILAAQQAFEEAKYQITIAALQKQSAAQQIQLDARNALQKRNFDDALTTLQTHLAKGHDTVAEAHKEILKLFKSFGISYGAAGRALGTAFITELKTSIQEAAAGSGALSTKLKETASGIKIPHAATGGYVAQTGLAVIHAGETITPAGQGSGHTFNFYGWVADKQAVVEAVRNELIRTGRNTTGGALGGFG